MQKAERIRLAQPFFEPDEIDAVVDVLRSGQLVQGSQVEAFEQAVASYLGAREAVACSNGTAALHLALMALEIGPGDEVIIPDYTFPATANMIEALGATTVVVDIDLDTFNLDTDAVAGRITRRTRAIIPVHLFGLIADLRPLVALAADADIPVIEDAACALGAWYPGDLVAPDGASDALQPLPGIDGERRRMIASETAMACLSFHPRKVITTGEGGMVVTNDPRMARQLRLLRNHGSTPLEGRMSYGAVGFNYRMTEMQAALGVTQMKRLETFIRRRRHLAGLYDQLLAALPVAVPVVPSGYGHIYQSYVVLLPESVDRDDVLRQLKEQQIEATLGTYALHQQPYYQHKYRLGEAAFPRSAAAWRRSLALPIHPRMADADVRRVVSALAKILEGFRP